jgi:hypothetical protein
LTRASLRFVDLRNSRLGLSGRWDCDINVKQGEQILKYKKEMLVGIVIAVVLYFVAVRTIGVAAAVATPAGYFDWYRSNDLVWLGLAIWNLCTLYPAAAIPSLIITSVGVKVSAAKWLPVCYVVVLLYLAYFFYGQISLTLQYPQFIEINGYRAFIPSLVIPAFVFLGGFLSTKRLTKRSTRTQ